MEAKSVALFRALTDEDHPFLYNSWLKSYRDSPAVASVPNTLYYAGQHAVIERLLREPGRRALVACNPDDPSQIYGYALTQETTRGPVVHWVYVKHPFRNFGLARALVSQTIGDEIEFTYTHRVKNESRLLKNKKAVFNPYAAY